MGKSYRPYLPEQDLLLAPSLRDWLPESHLVYFVSDVVDQLGEQRKIRGFVAQGRESRQQEAPADSGGPASRRMVKRLQDRRGKRQYRRRKGLVEPAFGWVKQVLGFRQFSLRGLKKVQGEWSLVTLALNLRRMAAMEAVPASI